MAAPAVAVLAAAVRLTSPGPAFFAAERVGRGGTRIRVLKLRSMASTPAGAGPALTAAADPRVTPLGRWLRRTRLDELPQLWNVVRGEMSLVGPRPESPCFVCDTPQWRRLLSVRPGLTGTAALAFRDEEVVLAAADDLELAYREVVLPAKLRLSRHDVAPHSPAHDLRVLARTLAIVWLGWGRPPHPLRLLVARRVEALNRARMMVP